MSCKAEILPKAHDEKNARRGYQLLEIADPQDQGSAPASGYGNVPFLRRHSYELSFLHLLMMVASLIGVPIVQ